MTSETEKELQNLVKTMQNQKMISISDISDLLSQIDKTIMQLNRVTDSRNQWKEKYINLKNQINEKLVDQ